jgi:hypothetical protein
LYVDAVMIDEGGFHYPFILGQTKSIEDGERNKISEAGIEIFGFTGSGYLRIYLGERNIIEGEIEVKGCTCEIYISSVENEITNNSDRKAILFNQNVTGSRGVIQTFRCFYVYPVDIIIIGNDQCRYAIAGYNTYLRIQRCEGYEVDHSVFMAGFGSKMENDRNVGSGPRGLYVHGSSTLGGQGTAPRGTISNITALQGGGVFTTNFDHQSGMNPLSDYEPMKTSTWTPNAFWGYTSNTGWHSNTVIQGKRPTDPPLWYGLFFFNTRDFSELKNPDGTDREIHSIRFRIRRTSHTGENNSRRPNFHWSSKNSASGSAPSLNDAHRSAVGFTWGQERWVTLPISHARAFQNGSARSLVIFDGSREQDYMRFMNEGLLEIVHG